MIKEVCLTIMYGKISLPTIKAANVEVRAVRKSKDTPSRSPYHMPFTMLEQLPKKVWLITITMHMCITI